jgi:hypothetical protein
MQTATYVFEERVRNLWRDIVPGLDDLERRILLISISIRYNGISPYKLARMTDANIATVYRKVKRLIEKRLLLPINPPENKVSISVKGCITLYTQGIIGVDTLIGCIRRLWDLEYSMVTCEAVLGLLYILGIEAKRRRLNITNMTMCMMDEASIHAIRIIKEALTLHINEGVSFSRALDIIAERLEMPPRYLREGIRLAVRGASKAMPLIVNLENDTVAVFIHDRFIIPFVLECKRPCKHYWNDFGFDCPRVREELRRKLFQLISETPESEEG